ncbi:MAG TPA: hypothetical protein VFN35_09420 [Ktedonobacteraceae bacterium]|nr:hypothetical protein [Ktedonobacteraceae bacterium]
MEYYEVGPDDRDPDQIESATSPGPEDSDPDDTSENSSRQV